MSTAIQVIAGPSKLVADLRLASKVFFAGLRRFGLRRLVRELKRYLRDNRNLLEGSADRYLVRDGQAYAASALPPVTSDAFVRYLLEEVESFNARRLSPLVFALVSATSRCPYRCRYCYALDDLRPDEHLPADALRRAVSDLADMGIPSLFLTGGEVMLRREELPYILEPAVEKGLAVWLVSTGWEMTKESLAGLLPYNLKGVVISLDSRHPAVVAEAKGSKQAFERATNALRAARELGLFTSVDCVATAKITEPEEFEAYLGFLTELGVHFVNFLPPHQTGGAKTNAIPPISGEEFKRLEALMLANNRGRKNRGRPLAYSAVIWEHSRGCVGGQQFIYVNPLGDVRPCAFLVHSVGNIKERSITEIIARLRGEGAKDGCFSMIDDLPKTKRLSRLPIVQG